MLHLGIDIGGTKMEAVLLDPAGECVQRLRRPTHKESYDAFMRQLLTLIADIRAVSPQPFTLGIGLPGAIDPQSGRIKNCNCLGAQRSRSAPGYHAAAWPAGVDGKRCRLLHPFGGGGWRRRRSYHRLRGDYRYRLRRRDRRSSTAAQRPQRYRRGVGA